MKAATEELLYFLPWTLESVTRPSLASLDDSFESWAARQGLLRHVHRLEQRRFVECAGRGPDERLVRLTAKGRRVAVGGIDPPERWKRTWDGRWRMIVYDVPNRWSTLRIRLARTLQRHRFGRLQKSVWITPDSDSSLTGVLQRIRARAHSLVVFDAITAGGEDQADLVRSAWDWRAINGRYEACLRLLGRIEVERSAGTRASVIALAAQEQAAWKEACALDPFCPEVLLPPGYLGRSVWERRTEILPSVVGTPSRQLTCQSA